MVITLVLVNQKSCHKNAEVVFFYVLEARKKSFKNTTFVPFKVVNILESVKDWRFQLIVINTPCEISFEPETKNRSPIFGYFVH